MWGYPHSLLLFKLVEDSISSGCSSSEWCFFFYLCLTGDDSVNAGGLDIVSAVFAWVVIDGSVIASVVVAVVVIVVVVVVVALHLGGEFPLFTDYQGPPVFFFRMVSRLQIWLTWRGCQGCCCCCCCCCCWFHGFLKAWSCKMA